MFNTICKKYICLLLIFPLRAAGAGAALPKELNVVEKALIQCDKKLKEEEDKLAAFTNKQGPEIAKITADRDRHQSELKKIEYAQRLAQDHKRAALALIPAIEHSCELAKKAQHDQQLTNQCAAKRQELTRFAEHVRYFAQAIMVHDNIIKNYNGKTNTDGVVKPKDLETNNDVAKLLQDLRMCAPNMVTLNDAQTILSLENRLANKATYSIPDAHALSMQANVPQGAIDYAERWARFKKKLFNKLKEVFDEDDANPPQ